MGDIDLSDNTLYDAYDDVKNDRTKTNWCLFGYASLQSNKLKVLSKGEGGLDEFIEELETGNACYGIVRTEMNLSGSMQTKYLYVVWSPDGVPATRKSAVYGHARTVGDRIFKGYHTQLTAKNKEDLAMDSKLAAWRLAS